MFQADLATRSVKISGAPAIDPQRTSLPDAWRGLPAFRLTARGPPSPSTELRRGEAAAAPRRDHGLNRSWWLAEDGRRFTVQDRLDGTLHRGGRLEALVPAELGRVALGEERRTARLDQVITVAPDGGTDWGAPAGPPQVGPPQAGVEVRRGELLLAADLTYPARLARCRRWAGTATSRASGATLHLPPGWTLIAALGGRPRRRRLGRPAGRSSISSSS